MYYLKWTGKKWLYYNKFDEYPYPKPNPKLTHITVQDPNACGLIKLAVKEWWNDLGYGTNYIQYFQSSRKANKEWN